MAKYTERKFQLGEYWLSQRKGSPAWYRTWYENRQTRRASLSTADFGEAKQKLTEWYITNVHAKAKDLSPEDVTLAEVFKIYYDEHGHALRSHATIKILLRYWLDWWGEATVHDVRDIHKQEEFHAWLFAKGLNGHSVNRTMEMGRAAIRRAWRRGMIESFPHVELVKAPEPKPKGRPLEPSEIIRLYENSADHLRLVIAIMLGTACRTEAAYTLTWEQVEFDAGLVQLNPEGRAQTSKRRPTVPLIPSLRAILNPVKKSTGRIVTFRGQSVSKVQTAFRKARMRANLDGEVNPYSLRHTCARWMRKDNVPIEQVAQQLGHRLEGYNMTERYAAWSPDYLSAASVSLEKLFMASVPKTCQSVPNAR